MDVTLKTTLDVTPCQETLKTALFFVNLSFVLFIFALADLGKESQSFCCFRQDITHTNALGSPTAL